MNIKTIIHTVIAFCVASTVANAEIVKRSFHYDISQSMGKDQKSLVTLFYKEKDGSITYISLASEKLTKYLKTLVSPTVILSINHDKKHDSIEFVKIDNIKWSSLEDGRFWTGKIPKFTTN
jgi:hypothetical protein